MNRIRTFLFVWAKKEKYSEPIKRHNVITVRNATGDIGSDAGYATNCFCQQFGSLSKVDILLPNEKKQCEILWKPVYEEYRRIGYRLRKKKDYEQLTIFDFEE